MALDGYITDFTVIASNIDDRDVVWELTANSEIDILIGDKGYIGQKVDSQLEETRYIRL